MTLKVVVKVVVVVKDKLDVLLLPLNLVFGDWSEFLDCDKEIKIKDCLSWNKKTRLMLEIVHVHRWLIVMLEKYLGN